jgi:hypothetical protein
VSCPPASYSEMQSSSCKHAHMCKCNLDKYQTNGTNETHDHTDTHTHTHTPTKRNMQRPIHVPIRIPCPTCSQPHTIIKHKDTHTHCKHTTHTYTGNPLFRADRLWSRNNQILYLGRLPGRHTQGSSTRGACFRAASPSAPHGANAFGIRTAFACSLSPVLTSTEFL